MDLNGTVGRRCGVVAILAAAAVAILAWVIWGNCTIQTTVLEVSDPNLPVGLEGYRIAQISDLHNAQFGDENCRLLRILRQQEPDLIALTGDLVDSRRTNLDVAVSFAEQAVQIAPCYYVTGNHEARLQAQFGELEERLRRCGVTVLHNQSETIFANGERIQLIGVDDPDFAESGMFRMAEGIVRTEIQNAGAGAGYRILLSHRPELFDVYVQEGIQLAFCGHAHGGQFRLPFLGGVIAPDQGLFPRYDAGLYRQGGTAMIVSRGVGNSIIPVRVNNRPEVVIAVLHGASSR